jgi:hypothetical protein
LTWTLGGYPSLSLSLVKAHRRGILLDEWYKESFGEEGERVHDAVKIFCCAIEKLPFSIDSLYFSPRTLGCANLWDLCPEEKRSMMVSFAFDDVESYMNPYPARVYVTLLSTLIEEFSVGIKILEGLSGKASRELLTISRAFLCHMSSDLNSTLFSLCKRADSASGMRSAVIGEKKNAEKLLSIIRQDCRIGFEASNHYFYTERQILEKIIRMTKFEKILDERLCDGRGSEACGNSVID